MATVVSDYAYEYAEKFDLDPERVQYLIDKGDIK